MLPKQAKQAPQTETSSATPFRPPTEPERRGSAFCHPDGGSNATGWKDLEQLRASEAGSGFGSPHPKGYWRHFNEAEREWRLLTIRVASFREARIVGRNALRVVDRIVHGRRVAVRVGP